MGIEHRGLLKSRSDMNAWSSTRLTFVLQSSIGATQLRVILQVLLFWFYTKGQASARITKSDRVAAHILKSERANVSFGLRNMDSQCSFSLKQKFRKYAEYLQALERLEEDRKSVVHRWDGKRAYDFYEPEWVCESEVRVGPAEVNVGDGPKFVCGVEYLKEESDCLVYSIGSSYNFIFEEGMHKHAPNCELHIFDGTVNLTRRALPPELEENGFRFHNWNLQIHGGTDANGFPSKTLEDTLETLAHVGKTIHVFKIDCEGCEYSVLPRLADMVTEGTIRVGQIQVEMHGADAPKIQTLFQVLRRAGFMIFHKERNHWGCNGFKCVEYALVGHEMASSSFLQHSCCGKHMHNAGVQTYRNAA
uniref:Methyltransferase domain-containing protein n=1 Tax=Picocystis salinarum TaxID=88271 RepID=A0A7S3XCQ9_9CHLO|mmetsp:Transcript_8807/g.54118  ORF Transcript_8807/g.54118 Transcript_8807/m.54118 type:complete len:362 (-) Transcript_8807:1473-2558(-)